MQEPTHRPGWPWKWLLRLGGAGCGALSLAGLLAVVEARRGRSALDSGLARFRASGESLDINACRPPSVPDASNAWLAIRTWTNQLAGKPGVVLRDTADRGRPRAWRGVPEEREEGRGGEDWDRLRAEVGERAEALSAVGQALTLPDYDTVVAAAGPSPTAPAADPRAVRAAFPLQPGLHVDGAAPGRTGSRLGRAAGAPAGVGVA